MKPQKTKLLKREFAETLGCLPIVVSRLVKTGEVKTDVNGKIDISSPKMQSYIKNKREEIQRHKEKITRKELKIGNEKDNQFIETSNNKPNQNIVNQNPNRNIESAKNSLKKDKLNNSDQPNFHSIEYETKCHKLDSERCKAELLEMEVKHRKKDLINTELLNRIISKTIGNLSKNIIEIPSNIVDEIIDIVKTEEEPKPIIVNLITKALHKEIEATINKAEKEFLKL